MAKIRSLYDAIIKTKVQEDKCTNFLLWLLKKLPSNILLKIFKLSNLSIIDNETNFEFQVQYQMDDSRPDALIVFSESQYLIIETKRFPNKFDNDQFSKHLKNGQKEFGKENVWILFLSGDGQIPNELEIMKNKYEGRIGFLPWKSLLKVLNENKDSMGEKYDIIIDEFLIFANYYKLGRLISMNKDELKTFFEIYPTVAKYEDAVNQTLITVLDKIIDGIIVECEELVERNDDENVPTIPCLYKTLNIKNWYIKKSSGFVFISALNKKIGVVLKGYENDEKEKAKFIQLWDEKYKNKYREDLALNAFKYVFEDDENSDIYGEYFELVDGMSGKLFNPTQISEFTDCFYWGYVYELDLENFNSHYETIPKDFKKLLNTFVDSNDTIHQNAKAKKYRKR